MLFLFFSIAEATVLLIRRCETSPPEVLCRINKLASGRIGAIYFRFLFAYKQDLATGSQSCQPPLESRSGSGFFLTFPQLQPGFPEACSHASRVLTNRLRFVIIAKVFWQWRYRLGVRTEDSQSSNPGSIPGSATNSAFPIVVSSNMLNIGLVAV